MKQMMSTLPPVVFFRELQNGECLYIYCMRWYIFTEVQSGQFLHCLLWYFSTEVQSGQCLYCLLWYLFHRGTKWTMSILPVVAFVSQRYKVDNICTACYGICFTEVQSRQCLFCLLWYCFTQGQNGPFYTACCGICFTEVQSGQCLYCLLWYFFQRYKVDNVCTTCYFYFLLWLFLFHRGT